LISDGTELGPICGGGFECRWLSPKRSATYHRRLRAESSRAHRTVSSGVGFSARYCAKLLSARMAASVGGHEILPIDGHETPR